MSEAESKAQATKSQAESQAKNRMNQGRQEAQGKLGGVGLSMDGSYEAKAVSGGETIMRSNAQGATNDDEARQRAQEAAKQAAQAAIQEAQAQAKAILDTMKAEIAKIFTTSRALTNAEIEQTCPGN